MQRFEILNCTNVMYVNVQDVHMTNFSFFNFYMCTKMVHFLDEKKYFIFDM